MISVFSDYLNPIKGKIVNFREPKKPSEVYCQIRNAYNQGVEGILETTRLIVPDPEEEGADAILEMLVFDPRIKSWKRAVNRHILLNIGSSYKTINVTLRIITGMLNNLVKNGIVQKRHAIWMHNSLTRCVREEQGLIYSEDLPF